MFRMNTAPQKSLRQLKIEMDAMESLLKTWKENEQQQRQANNKKQLELANLNIEVQNAKQKAIQQENEIERITA